MGLHSDSQVAKSIGINGRIEPLNLTCVDGIGARDINSQKVTFGISAIDGTIRHTISNARTLGELKLPRQSLKEETLQRLSYLSHIPIEAYENAVPILLIGQDHWDLITPIRIVTTTRELPAASLTKLGWVVHGQVPEYTASIHPRDYTLFTSEQEKIESDDDLHHLVKLHFTLESIGVSKIARRNKLDNRAEEILKRTTKHVESGWITGLLWRNDDTKMPSNRATAVNRLMKLERKMDRDPIYKEKYSSQMDHLIKMGYAKKVVAPETHSDREWYLPHFGTVNVNKPNKIRPVFDASSKTDGTSLNDNLLTGPAFVSSLLGVLIRFRKKKIGFMGDIREMFLQIKIQNEDQVAQRFLWRRTERHHDPDTYTMTTLIFGATSSPCSAQYVMNKNAAEFRKNYPASVRAIEQNHYVDDYLDSEDTVEEGIQRIKEVTKIHKKGGFEIRGWVSNDTRILEGISNEKTANKAVNLTSDPTERALGLKWNLNSDTISFNLNSIKITKTVGRDTKNLTKRQMLSVIMSIYDPLGFLLPFTIRSKLLLQNVWRSKVGWDDRLHKEELDQWNLWFSDIRKMESYHVHRHYFHQLNEPRNIELHIFSDASDKAYSAVAYLRSIDVDNKINLSFVVAKARVGPLKKLSIPRMELQGALVASRLGETIIKELEMSINRRIFWTDSSTVLNWIKAEPRKYEPFVAHRLGEIDETTNTAEWRWVPSKENPADSATKEIGSLKNQMEQWLRGAKFLLKNEDEWPTQRLVKSNVTDNIKNQQEFSAAIVCKEETVLPNVTRFSKWLRLIRCTAWILLSLRRWRRQSKPSLNSDYLEKAELLWVKKVQHDCFYKELQHAKKGEPLPKDSRLNKLTPILSRREEILRVDGRINAAERISHDTKFPIILDGKHPYTQLLVHYYHEKAGHVSPEIVVNEMRQKYWILQLRPTVRSVSNKCQWCRVQRNKPQIPRMGELPNERVKHHHRPFTFCGMDYFGPIAVTVGRRQQKRWGVLVTCLTTRAVHLEIASSLSADSTIMALRRMMARRGNPTEIFSDNGTNMVGANTELKRAISEIDRAQLKQELTNCGIKWRFIPPGTPHMGGSWERLLRNVKVALNAVLTSRAPK